MRLIVCERVLHGVLRVQHPEGSLDPTLQMRHQIHRRTMADVKITVVRTCTTQTQKAQGLKLDLDAERLAMMLENFPNMRMQISRSDRIRAVSVLRS